MIRRPQVTKHTDTHFPYATLFRSAFNLLKFVDKKAAHRIKKVVESAIANAENNQGADVDELKVKTIMVDEGPTLKRFMARAKGRGNRILKRTSHITVVVGEGN